MKDEEHAQIIHSHEKGLVSPVCLCQKLLCHLWRWEVCFGSTIAPGSNTTEWPQIGPIFNKAFHVKFCLGRISLEYDLATFEVHSHTARQAGGLEKKANRGNTILGQQALEFMTGCVQGTLRRFGVGGR